MKLVCLTTETLKSVSIKKTCNASSTLNLVDNVERSSSLPTVNPEEN